MNGTHAAGYGYPAPYGPVQPRVVKTSVGGLGTAVSILLGLDALFSLLGVGALAWRSSLLDTAQNDPGALDADSADTSDNLVRFADGLLILTILATVVVFMCWFFAARHNAEAYAPNRGTMSTGWSIGGWFIPLAVWVIPCIVARDIYKGTMLGRQGKHTDSGGYITGWWWALFVGAWLSLFGVSSKGDKATEAEGESASAYLKAMKSLTNAGIFTLVLLTAAAVLAICYVQTITRTQKQRNAEGDWYNGPGSRMRQGLPPYPTGYEYGYGYGMPVPGGYPMPMPGQPMPMPPTAPAPVQDAVPGQYPPAPPTQDAIPVQRPPAGSGPATSGPAADDDPFAAPSEDLIPPS